MWLLASGHNKQDLVELEVVNLVTLSHSVPNNKVASFVFQLQQLKDVLIFKMEKIINLGIPHVGEQIFEMIETQDLTKYLKFN